MTTPRDLRHSWAQLARIFYHESRLEFVKCLRLPAFSVSLFVFPIGMYLLFGLGIHFGPSETPQSLYWAITGSSLGVVIVGIFGFGVYVATERGQGWLLLKRVSPMPPLMYFAAKTTMSIIFSCLIVVAIFVLAVTLGQVRLPWVQFVEIFVTLVLTTIPFCTLGLAIGYIAGPNSAHAVVNVVYLPMIFLSGILVPIHVLPPYLQTFGTFLPTYHTNQLALNTIGAAQSTSMWIHALVAALYAVAFLAIAIFRFHRDEGSTYG